MSASLVGSEMCIRDSHKMYHARWIHHWSFPHEHIRPQICYHKRVRYYMAESWNYGPQNTPNLRTDGDQGR
eukprot:724165-Alexandrium_andersonii.AAC.1